MLVLGKVDHGIQPGNTAPWIDANFEPIDEYLKLVEAQTHRRFIKTHTPFDGIPYYPECTYFAVFRDPRDMFCSMLNHRDNWVDEDLAFTVFPSGESAFGDWVTGKFDPDAFDIQSLDGAVHFLKTYWEFRELPNVHLFHYSEMKRDLKGNIARMADAIEIEVSDALLDDMTAAATFESMKKNAEQFAPLSGTGLWKQEAGFFASGTNSQWKGVLTDSDLKQFDAEIGKLLNPEQLAWLVRS